MQSGEEVAAPPQTVIPDQVSKNSSTRRIRLLGLIVAIIIGGAIIWYLTRPIKVSLIKPIPATITETISSSGRVGGTTETNVGAQMSGVVQRLYVDDGAVVVRGQRLALIRNEVATAQTEQMRAALATARSQLLQTSRGSLPSDIEVVREQVREAQAQVEQRSATITQAQRNVLQAKALLAQFQAERTLSKKELGRSTELVEKGVISKSEFDQAATAFEVAEKRVTAQREAVAFADSTVKAARAGLKSAQATVASQQARLRTIQSGARSEDITISQDRIIEAERALRVAEQQAANAVVVAPFSGTVTRINTEEGQTVGTLGVLVLVSDQLEVRIDVDESNLPTLAVGQKAIISSSVFSAGGFDAVVSEIAAAVDVTRGTIEVKVVPVETLEWLRPGQTVDVNIITAEKVERLLVPQTALVRKGDATVVFVITEGHIAARIVTTNPPTKDGVPVVSGLTADEEIVVIASAVTDGEAVQAE